jgi:hypothetical protein
MCFQCHKYGGKSDNGRLFNVHKNDNNELIFMLCFVMGRAMRGEEY